MTATTTPESVDTTAPDEAVDAPPVSTPDGADERPVSSDDGADPDAAAVARPAADGGEPPNGQGDGERSGAIDASMLYRTLGLTVEVLEHLNKLERGAELTTEELRFADLQPVVTELAESLPDAFAKNLRNCMPAGEPDSLLSAQLLAGRLEGWVRGLLQVAQPQQSVAVSPEQLMAAIAMQQGQPQGQPQGQGTPRQVLGGGTPQGTATVTSGYL